VVAEKIAYAREQELGPDVKDVTFDRRCRISPSTKKRRGIAASPSVEVVHRTAPEMSRN